MFAAHHKLDNLVAITDCNKMQIDGTTKEILDIEPLADKWRAFKWEVFEIDGHNWDRSTTPCKRRSQSPASRR